MWAWIINQDWLALVTSAGSIATAIATVFLWRVTKGLYDATQVMAKATSRAQVVANIQMNEWSIIHADISISNTGNATAFDITVDFDPPLTPFLSNNTRKTPFTALSILRPNDAVQSYLGNLEKMLDVKFKVTTTWKEAPTDKERKCLTYELDMAGFKGRASLGGTRPEVEIAKQVKLIREDWRKISMGYNRIGVDSYTEEDRSREREEWERRMNADSDDEFPKISDQPSAS